MSCLGMAVRVRRGMDRQVSVRSGLAVLVRDVLLRLGVARRVLVVFGSQGRPRRGGVQRGKATHGKAVMAGYGLAGRG